MFAFKMGSNYYLQVFWEGHIEKYKNTLSRKKSVKKYINDDLNISSDSNKEEGSNVETSDEEDNTIKLTQEYKQ